MSPDDIAAEARIAFTAAGATGYPLVGLTTTNDGSYSARIWERVAPKRYRSREAESVRVVGRCLRITRPTVERNTDGALERTESVWGRVGQDALAQLRVGIAGLGSVGSCVAEGLARMGFENVVLVDRDVVEIRNLDRLLNATRRDLGRLKVDVARDALLDHRTALSGTVTAVSAWCDEESGYRSLLDCDAIFSCVDRPWPRRVLNQLSYANLVPIVDGGILVRKRGDRLIGADWHAHTSGPHRRCLKCLAAFDPGDAAVDRDGLLDNPGYIKQLDPRHPLIAKENVFPFSTHVASMELLQLAAMVVGPQHYIGDQNHHYATGKTDVTQNAFCEADCPFYAVTAQGDAATPPLRTTM
jgi:hypothetical protein